MTSKFGDVRGVGLKIRTIRSPVMANVDHYIKQEDALASKDFLFLGLSISFSVSLFARPFEREGERRINRTKN